MSPPRRPRLITFDAFGTLFQLEEDASAAIMETIVERNGLEMAPGELGRRWWDLSYQVAYASFVTVREATHRALERLLQEAGAEDDAAPYAERLLEEWSRTAPFPEVEEALDRLRDFDLGIVSNVDDDVLNTLLERARIRHRFRVVVTSESVRTYKPEPGIFRQALSGARCPPEAALHLGDSPVDDVLGPKRVGMMAGWINRRGEAMRGRIPPPELEAGDLLEAAEIILAAPGS